MACASSAPHLGHPFTATDQSLGTLHWLASSLFEEVPGLQQGLEKAAVDWRASVAAAEFISECQCCLVEATAEKVKALADAAAAASDVDAADAASAAPTAA